MSITGQIITLTNKQGMSIKLSDWGATWLSCVVPVDGEKREVLLGCASLEQYKKQDAYLGATVGRYANRIANASIDTQDKHYALIANQGVNQLHGGLIGFDKRLWNIQDQSSQQVIFQLTSLDGDQGFPGELVVTVTYALTDDNQVKIIFNANTNKITPVNLTNHAYFNLDGDAVDSAKDAREQTLQINANYYLPVGSDGIPNGDLTSVANNDMDLRKAKRLLDRFLESAERKQVAGYDHAYLLDKTQPIAAQLTSADHKLVMDVITTKPALQVYSGNFLKGTLNRQNDEYDNFAGIALEAQFLPDSPNHPEWPQPSCWLQPDQTYHHQIIYAFSVKNSA